MHLVVSVTFWLHGASEKGRLYQKLESDRIQVFVVHEITCCICNEYSRGELRWSCISVQFY